VKKQGKRLRFLGLNTVDDVASGLGFQRRYGWTWPSLRDPERKLAQRFGATYQPAFILVDARGRVVGGFQAAGTPARWDALVSRLP
jgi:hypothetical protein